MIMAKFQELQRIEEAAVAAAAAGGQQARCEAVADAATGSLAPVQQQQEQQHQEQQQQQQQQQLPPPAPGAPTGAASGLTDDQLLQVFKATSQFSVRTALQDNHMLLGIDEILEHASDRCGGWRGEGGGGGRGRGGGKGGKTVASGCPDGLQGATLHCIPFCPCYLPPQIATLAAPAQLTCLRCDVMPGTLCGVPPPPPPPCRCCCRRCRYGDEEALSDDDDDLLLLRAFWSEGEEEEDDGAAEAVEC